jgi:hypothetical protein
MQDQLIEGMSFAQYRDIDAEHSGVLRRILTSPLAYRRSKDLETAGVDKDRDCLRLGRAVHTAVLEPHLFPKLYTCWSGGRRAGHAWDDFESSATASGVTILKEDQIDLAVKVSKAARSEPAAAPILNATGRAEVVIVWRHPRTGVDIKVRIDWLTADTLVDLKTCRDPAPHRFATTAAQLGYHFQLALYADAAAAVGLGSLAVKIVAAQSTEPHDVVVYSLDEDVLFRGRDEYERALDQLVECRQSDKWPGQAGGKEMALKLPAWCAPADEELTYEGEVMP